MQENTTSQSSLSNRPRTLKSWQLTVALVLVTLIPFSLVVLLYRTFPVGKDPVLESVVEIAPRAVLGSEDNQSLLVQGVVLENPTEGKWENVNLSVNKQFHYAHGKPILSGEEVFIPLKFFHTKGNQRFPADSQPLKSLIIYAQIETKARAIREISWRELAGVSNLRGSKSLFAEIDGNLVPRQKDN